MRISKWFTREEMACKCGCGFDSIDVETLQLADECRDFVGVPITPSSVSRCAEYNQEIGGAERSQHIFARAMDLPVPDPEALYEYLNENYPNKYGIGLYNTFVHIDTRTDGPARWDLR